MPSDATTLSTNVPTFVGTDRPTLFSVTDGDAVLCRIVFFTLTGVVKVHVYVTVTPGTVGKSVVMSRVVPGQ